MELAQTNNPPGFFQKDLISGLNEEILLHIFSFCSSLPDRQAVLEVSHLFKRIIEDKSLNKPPVLLEKDSLKRRNTAIVAMIAEDYKKGCLSIMQSPEEQKEGSFTITFLETIRQDPKQNFKLTLFLLSHKTDEVFYHCIEKYAAYPATLDELDERGRSREALEYEKKVLAMREAFFSGESHPDLATSLANIGNRVSQMGGEIHEALRYTEKAPAMRKRLFSEKPYPDLAASLESMANLLSRQDRPQEALWYQQKAFKMRKALDVEDRPSPY